MNDEPTKTDTLSSTELRVSDGDNSLHSLSADSKHEVCEVHAAISAANIQIAVVTAYAGISVSAIFALTLLAVYAVSAFSGRTMLAPPWYVVDIATALFTAGAISALHIPRRLPWERNDRQD